MLELDPQNKAGISKTVAARDDRALLEGLRSGVGFVRSRNSQEARALAKDAASGQKEEDCGSLSCKSLLQFSLPAQV